MWAPDPQKWPWQLHRVGWHPLKRLNVASACIRKQLCTQNNLNCPWLRGWSGAVVRMGVDKRPPTSWVTRELRCLIPFHILNTEQWLRKWILCPGFCSPGQGQERVAVALLVIPKLCVLVMDVVTMMMELYVLDHLHSSLECLKQMGKLETLAGGWLSQRHQLSPNVQSAGQFLTALPRPGLVVCRLTLVVGCA